MASKWDMPSSSGLWNTDEDNAESKNLKLLKPLDEILRCPICFEYLNDCMMTKCGHNYCSLCIRRYMMYKSQCPSCFQVTSEPELKNNRLIDEILAIYKTLRNNFEKKHVGQTSSSSVKKDCSGKKIEILQEKVTDSFLVNEQYDSGSCQKNNEKVPCPICNLLVSPAKINFHLDDCLINNERFQNPPTNKMKLLPKVVYHLLTDSEIKKRLQQHGLGILGDRQALIRRHKSFLVLYNANCDSLNPKTVSELVEEVEAQENEEQTNMTRNRIHQFHKKSELAVIEKEQELYLRKHCDQFDALIEDVRRRLEKEKIKSQQNENITSNLLSLSEVKNAEEGDSDTSHFEEDNPRSTYKLKNPSRQPPNS